MAAILLDGRELSAHITAQLQQAVHARQLSHQAPPGLAVILVGQDPASEIYVERKRRACAATGIRSDLHRLPETVSASTLRDLIDRLNHQADVHGILLQVPLPAHLNADDLLECIAPHKDVDGFHPYNLGRLAQRRPTLRPCTPYGIIQLLEHYQLPCAGKHAVIVGASNIVGRPMALELLLKKATVTVCHRFTQDLATHVASADILIAACGNPNVIDATWIKPGAVVVDAGITRLKNGSIVGDINQQVAQQRAGHLTPVPGGVGPMTVATLLQNTLQAAETPVSLK